MVVKTFYGTREDGRKLFKSFDALVDESGNPVKDNDGNYIPSGFKIQKFIVASKGKRIKKDSPYNEAIDVKNAPYEYEPTDIPVEPVKGPEKDEQNEAKEGEADADT